jgi:putative ABC transport system permease protein
VDLRVAQDFFVYGDRVSEVAVLARSADAAPALRDRLRAGVERLGMDAEVLTWDQISPGLLQLIVLDDAGMYILLVILVVVVGFGILNTILMAVLERTRELGISLALGLRPAAVFRMVYLESLMIASVGLLVGLALALPVVLYMQAHPISLEGQASQAVEYFGFEPVMTWKLKPLNPIGSVIAILGVAALAALYPALKASRSRSVESLRSV